MAMIRLLTQAGMPGGTNALTLHDAVCVLLGQWLHAATTTQKPPPIQQPGVAMHDRLVGQRTVQ